jgi:hypothetical protein
MLRNQTTKAASTSPTLAHSQPATQEGTRAALCRARRIINAEPGMRRKLLPRSRVKGEGGWGSDFARGKSILLTQSNQSAFRYIGH